MDTSCTETIPFGRLVLAWNLPNELTSLVRKVSRVGLRLKSAEKVHLHMRDCGVRICGVAEMSGNQGAHQIAMGTAAVMPKRITDHETAYATSQMDATELDRA